MAGVKRGGGFLRGLLRLAGLCLLVLGLVWLAQNVDVERLGLRAGGELRGAVKQVEAAIPELELGEIEQELRQTGRVVRKRAASAVEQVAEATQDARTTAAIKARFALDPSLSAFAVSVDTTEGRVTLAGHVDSTRDIARAIEIAFEQDEVYEVVSTLQLRQRRSAHDSLSVPRRNAAFWAGGVSVEPDWPASRGLPASGRTSGNGWVRGLA